jgi:glutamate N-acetyltransferase/amino-acid N-acetyltransferase
MSSSCLPALRRAYTTQSSPLYTSPLGIKLSPSRQRLIPTSGTYPQGFRAGGALVGVKPSNKTRPDLALLASDRPCAAAAVFTKNKFQAAPVVFSRDLLARKANDGIRGVLINSGCANAVTGKGGREDAAKMAAAADAVLGGEGTIVMSTGVIGQR